MLPASKRRCRISLDLSDAAWEHYTLPAHISSFCNQLASDFSGLARQHRISRCSLAQAFGRSEADTRYHFISQVACGVDLRLRSAQQAKTNGKVMV
jgi:hypothetical protein